MKVFKNYIRGCYLVFFSILLTGGCAQKQMGGPCKDIKHVPDFDFKRYLGRWYEIARSPRTFEDDEKCTEFHYGDTADKGKFQITRLFVAESNGQKFNYTRKVKINRKTGQGMTTDAYSFTILDIGYDEYAVAYACLELSNGHKEVTWITTRDRMPDDEVKEKARKALLKYRISPASLEKIDQSDCPDNYDGTKKI